jgi:hypothetical protein
MDRFDRTSQKNPEIKFGDDFVIVPCIETAACRVAVTRAYDRLISSGADDRIAFEAAGKVYAWHHPEVPSSRVPYVIAEWLP